MSFTGEFDEPWVLLPDILDLHARHHPRKPALICGDAVLEVCQGSRQQMQLGLFG